MKLYKAEAIVIKSQQMREADRILTLYSRQHGKLRVAAHGVTKPTSRKRGAVQPFCHSHFMLRRGRELDSVSQCEGIEMFMQLRSSLDSMAYASYLCEMTDAFTMEGEANEELFLLLLATLRGLGRDIDFVLTRAFEIKLVSILGYMPSLRRCSLCGADIHGARVCFHPAGGGVLCPQCQEDGGVNTFYNRGSVEMLKLLLEWDTSRLGNLRLDAGSREEIRVLLRKYIEYHLERGMKSLKFLELLEKNV